MSSGAGTTIGDLRQADLKVGLYEALKTP